MQVLVQAILMVNVKGVYQSRGGRWARSEPPGRHDGRELQSRSRCCAGMLRVRLWPLDSIFNSSY